MSTQPRRAKTILLTEDSNEIRLVLRTFLEMRGYRVVEAADGQQAVEIVPRERPDLILMDLHMPKLDGFEAVKRIRRIGGFERVPVIAISAYGSHGMELFMRLDELGEGAIEYITKPLDLTDRGELADLLRRFAPQA